MVVIATLVKKLHAYGITVTETMRFANVASAERFRKDMLGKKVERPVAGSPYTVIAFDY
jgi:hypothetical protein